MAKNCYNVQQNFIPPTDITKPKWGENAERGNQWYEIMEHSNVGQWMRFALYGYGFHQSNTGTFSRSTWANQDPSFYPHHTFTFMLNDFGFKKLVENGRAAPPFYGIDKIVEDRGVKECPGHNPTDVTRYRNIVRYKQGQDIGAEQTWEHILDMWTEEKRDYEWIINDEYITNYDEILRNESSCVEGCFDEALIITAAFPDTMTLEEKCQAFVASLQQSTGKSKEEVCRTRLKDVPALNLPFLPDRFDLYWYSCKKTCNFCKNTCGPLEE